MTTLNQRYAPTPEERERIARIESLASATPPSIAFVTEVLGDPSWIVRRHAVTVLAEIGEPAVEPVCRMLCERRDDETLLAAAVEVLSASKAAVEDQLFRLLEGPDPSVVIDAVVVLGRRRSQQAVPRLVALAEHENDNVAVAALEALGRIGGRTAVDTLVRCVRSQNFFRVFPAIDVLGRSADPRAVPALAPLIDDPLYALEAVRALGHTGQRSAVAPLVAAITGASDSATRVAAQALVALAELHTARFAQPDAIEDELRRLVPATADRSIGRAMNGATPAELAALAWVLGAVGRGSAVPLLVAHLDAPAPGGPAAARALQKLGRIADDEVVRGLREGDSARRLVLLHSLGGASGIAEDVARCLSDDDPRVRSAACEALARMGNPTVVEQLFEALNDPNPGVLHAAIGAIQSLGSARTEQLTQRALASNQRQVRRAALRVAAYFGYSSVLPQVEAIFQERDAPLRDTAIEALALVEDPRAMELVTLAARDDSASTRAAAMRALALRGKDPRGVSYLMRGLRDPDPWVRYYACRSLGRLGWAAASEALAERVDDEAGQVRVAAIEALSHLGTASSLSALLRAAEGDDPDVRRAALLGIGIARWLEATQMLVRASRDPDPATRLVAISAMADFQVPEAVDALAAAARDEDEAVRHAAIGFLAARRTHDASRALISLTREHAGDEHVLAALSVPSTTRIAAIQEALLRADDALASNLMSALARMHVPLAEETIIATCASPNAAARRAACTTLGAIDSEEARQVLTRMVERDADASVRETCRLALER